jgi:uncharacterized protein (TIGR02996 family)
MTAASSELELLESIAAEPSDDSLLALAAWFDSRTDPRGELIRVQLQIARATDDLDGLPQLYRRSDELLPECEARWLASVASLLAKPDSNNYHPLQLRSGVPWSLYAGVAELTDNGSLLLQRLPTLTRLELRRHYREPIEGVFALEQLSRLTELRLFYCDLDDRELAMVLAAPFSRLSSLDLGCNRIGPDGARRLAASPLLAQLTGINLFRNRVADDGVAALAGSSRAARVTAVDVRGNGIGPRGARRLTEANHLNQVERLQLGDNPIGDDGARELASGTSLKRLVRLDLQCADLGVPGLEEMALWPIAGQLRELELGGNPLGDAGCESLRALGAFAALEVLGLDACGIGDLGAGELAAASHFACLGELSLRDNEIGDAGGAALQASPHFSPSLALDLYRNPISDGAVIAGLFSRFQLNF